MLSGLASDAGLLAALRATSVGEGAKGADSAAAGSAGAGVCTCGFAAALASDVARERAVAARESSCG
jgi:hypothetical protein